jgi:hypothetical protein
VPTDTVDLESYLLGDGADPPSGLLPAARAEADVARAFATGDGPAPRELTLDVALALCAALAARGDAARLGRLAAEAGKALAKEARRTLHALRARGASVAVPRSASRAVSMKAEEEPEPASVVTMIDGQGERGLWYARRAPEGGVLVFQAVLSDTKGFVEFVAGKATRKAHRNLLRDLVERAGFAATVVPGEYARWLLEEAYRQTEAAGRPVPPDFARARSDLGPAPAGYEQHPALARWPEAEPLLEAELPGLLELPELRTWIPEEDSLRHAALKVSEVDESRILVDEAQKHVARVEAVARETEAYFTAARRALYRRRLLDTAWLLHLAGRRDDDARKVRAAADAFAPADPPPPPNPLARRLFERVFNLAAVAPAAEAPPAEPGRLIMTPSEAAAQAEAAARAPARRRPAPPRR